MLLFMDGFDHYATADLPKKWTAVAFSVATPSVSAGTGRRGGASLLNGLNEIQKSFAPAGTLIFGSAILIPAFSINTFFVCFFDGVITAPQVSVVIDTSGRILVYRGSTSTGTLLATSTPVVPSNGYVYIECKVVFSNTGSYEIRVNGVNVLSGAADTTNTANNTASGVGWGYAFSSINYNTHHKDDIYICDATGSTNNDFLGDCRIDTLLPTTDGNYSQWTPNTGVVHFNRVNESAPDLTTYNAGLTVGNRDSYGMADLAALSSQIIYGVQVNAAALKDDAGSKSIATMVRSGGVDGDGATASLGTSQIYVSQVFETNPNGSVAWTEASVNAMEAGVKVTA